MRPVDIEALLSVSAPTIHPDGTHAVVAVSRPDLRADASVGQLWRVPLDGSGPRRLTRGRRDSAPAFSPDGRLLAFLRSDGASPQLMVVDAEGGEPVAVTDRDLGVGEFRWQGSEAIVFTSRVPEQGRYGTVDGLGAKAEPARRITGLKYKSNGLGYTRDRRTHVFRVAVPDVFGEPFYAAAPRPDGENDTASAVPEPEQLTDGDIDHTSPRVHGDDVYVLAAGHPSADRDLLSQIWRLGAGAAEAVTPLEGFAVAAFDIADDGTVHLLAQEVGERGTDFVARGAGLYRLEHGTPVLLTDPAVDDLTESGGSLVVQGDRVLVVGRERGATRAYAVDGSGATPLTPRDADVSAVAGHGDSVVVAYATPSTFGELGVVKGDGIRALTDFGADLRTRTSTKPRELTVPGRDGYPVHGWLSVPEGPGPHPTLLMIHGGPFAAYTGSVFDEVQVLTAAGYAVVYCNPRGGAGYGHEHGRVVRGAMGGVDAHDVLDFLDGALDAEPTLDRERLGILGGSYGGYLTAWTIAHDRRFRASVVERAYLEPHAFVGSSDIGMYFPQEYHDGPQGMTEQSAQAVAHLVTTPTLVIHSEDDLRCPIAQAETYFATLQLNGVDSEMLIFPGEDHELSRAGRPSHRVQRFDAILEWFGRHL